MNTTNDQKTNLIFIYNANKGLVNGFMDSAHKLMNPSTYKCDLCALTHGFFGMKKEWTEFLDRLNIEITFYHKNDIPEGMETDQLPMVLVQNEGHPQKMITAAQLGQLENLEDLMELIKSKVNLN